MNSVFPLLLEETYLGWSTHRDSSSRQEFYIATLAQHQTGSRKCSHIVPGRRRRRAPQRQILKYALLGTTPRLSCSCRLSNWLSITSSRTVLFIKWRTIGQSLHVPNLLAETNENRHRFSNNLWWTYFFATLSTLFYRGLLNRFGYQVFP